MLGVIYKPRHDRLGYRVTLTKTLKELIFKKTHRRYNSPSTNNVAFEGVGCVTMFVDP